MRRGQGCGLLSHGSISLGPDPACEGLASALEAEALGENTLSSLVSG